MALTTAHVTSATPATDLYNALATVLTTASWTHVGTKTAATMGTTASVEVWADPSTTVASNVYTGCVVYIEVDDTNVRLRFRVSEVFDNAATGSPATNVKFPAPGQTAGAATTPASDFSRSTSYQTLFQATGNTQIVGWTDVSVNTTGYDYWIGANARYVICGTNRIGASTNNWAVAGRLEYLAAVGNADKAVVLMGPITSSAVARGPSWTVSSTAMGNIRCSREPLTSSSLTGGFCFTSSALWPTTAVADLGGNMISGTNHRWHTQQVVAPIYIHGVVSGTPDGRRSHLGKMTDLVLACLTQDTSSPAEQNMGDTITISGETYVLFGFAVGHTVLGSSVVTQQLAVRTNAF